jgi:transcriptional regulator with XRE-family HTH domain
MRLGEIIHKWRTGSGAELRATARRIGINHTTLLRIERGEACDSRTLAKVLAWLLDENTP